MHRIEQSPCVFIITNDRQLPADEAIWGTGGWTAPTEREALDWLVLVRLLGWAVTPVYLDEVEECIQSLIPGDTLILACDPAEVGQDTAILLENALRRLRISLVYRVSNCATHVMTSPFQQSRQKAFQGQRLVWVNESGGRDWNCENELHACALGVTIEDRVLASLDGAPVVVQRSFGAGRSVALGFHPSVAADQAAAAIALLFRLLTDNPYASNVWLDWSRTMILRMDDPGGAQNVYSKNWCYQKLSLAAWREIGSVLAHRQARLSIGYVSGWVDDGNSETGALSIDGKAATRRAGEIYASPRVHYSDLAGNAPGTENDYGEEYEGIQELRSAGIADVELHGFTHICADINAWLTASDRYSNRSWFRDFNEASRPYLKSIGVEQHPLRLALDTIDAYFHTRPTCLICPGDQWNNDVLKTALALQLKLVSSYYLAIRHSNRFAWSTHICVPYLNEPAERWFVSGMPVVGYFHDYEPAKFGIQWVASCLDAWSAAGARRFIDFREASAALGAQFRLENSDGRLTLHFSQEAEANSWPRPLPMKIRIDRGSLPDTVLLKTSREQHRIQVQRETEREGRILVPALITAEPRRPDRTEQLERLYKSF